MTDASVMADVFPQLKVCVRCKESKPLSAFGKRAKSGDGLQFWCKPCKSEVSKEWRHTHGERWNANERERYWSQPEKRETHIARYKERMKNSEIAGRKKGTAEALARREPGQDIRIQ